MNNLLYYLKAFWDFLLFIQMTKSRKTVLLFIDHYALDNSPSLINLIHSISKKYNVFLIYQNNMQLTGKGNYPPHFRIYRLIGKQKAFLNFLKMRSDCFINGIRGIPSRRIYSLFHSSNLRSVIAIDPFGFVLSRRLLPNIDPIYYSLELYLSNMDYATEKDRPVMDEERAQIQRIQSLWIQSPERKDYFCRDYKLSPKIKTLYLPVTYQGEALPQKNTFLYERYGLDKTKKILIYTGNIGDKQCTKEYINQLIHLPEYYLFIQWPSASRDSFFLEVTSLIQERNLKERVIWTEDFFGDFNHIFPSLSSAFIGLGCYKPDSVNDETAGLSSGKIAAYLRCGLPTISFNFSSTRKSLQEPFCGVCINGMEEFCSAVRVIEENYEVMSRNALREYDKRYRFSIYENKIEEDIESGKLSIS